METITKKSNDGKFNANQFQGAVISPEQQEQVKGGSIGHEDLIFI